MEAGLSDDDEVEARVADYGTEFLQLADALEDSPGVRTREFEDLIIEAAETLIAGKKTPEWYSDGSGGLCRARPPWVPPQ